MSGRVSIVVPVFEQWSMVPGLVGSLLRQSVQPDEVIIVDNGSARRMIPADLPAHYRVLECGVAGSYAARNHGVRNASGDILVFTDADCVPEDGWLAALLVAIGGSDGRIVAGHIDVAASSTEPNAYEIYDMLRGIPQEQYVARGYAATANLGLRRSLFERLGGFDARRKSGGDADLCRRAVAIGATLLFVPDAVVKHPARSTWSELETKARRVKGGQVRHQKSAWGLATVIAKTALRPGLDGFRFLTARNWPMTYRVKACGVAVRLWGVELLEIVRLSLGAPEERR